EQVLATDAKNKRAQMQGSVIRGHVGAVRVFTGEANAGLAQIEQAVTELKPLVNENPDDLDLRLAYAKALEFQGTQTAQKGGMIASSTGASAKVAESAAELEVALKKNPGNARVLRQIAQVDYSWGNLVSSMNPTEAIRRYREGLARLSEM